MSRKDLVIKIKRMRQERSWSQAQLAEITNLSLRTIQRIESNGRCSSETLLSVAAAFEIDVKELTRVISHSSSESAIPRDKLHQRFKERRGIVMAITKLGTTIIGAGIAYLIILLVMTAYGASAFHQFYENMSPTIEAQLNEGYRHFLSITGIGLALYLGIWSGVFGVWRKKIWQGAGFLVLGIAVTVAALELLPWIQYPHDQYLCRRDSFSLGFCPVYLVGLRLRLLENSSANGGR
jgi:transcriptional regulator with XRE-family HTH domain